MENVAGSTFPSLRVVAIWQFVKTVVNSRADYSQPIGGHGFIAAHEQVSADAVFGI